MDVLPDIVTREALVPPRCQLILPEALIPCDQALHHRRFHEGQPFQTRRRKPERASVFSNVRKHIRAQVPPGLVLGMPLTHSCRGRIGIAALARACIVSATSGE